VGVCIRALQRRRRREQRQSDQARSRVAAGRRAAAMPLVLEYGWSTGRDKTPGHTLNGAGQGKTNSCEKLGG